MENVSKLYWCEQCKKYVIENEMGVGGTCLNCQEGNRELFDMKMEAIENVYFS